MLGVILLQKCCFLISFMQVQFAQAEKQTVITKIAGGGRIGYNSMMKQFPFMARLVMDGDKRCGGTVISDRIIATALHCITPCPCFPQRNWNLCLNICFVKLRENSDQQADTETVHTIQAVHLPEKSGDPYQEPKGDWTDLALLELSRSVNHCEEKASTRDCWPIRKVRLPDPDIQISIGDAVRTLGWGKTAFDQDSEYLKQLDISIQTLTSFDHLIETNLAPGGGDTCQGDSGGPLLIRNKEDLQWTLIGTLLGGGVDCDDLKSFLGPDLTQDTSSDWNKLMPHLTWIKKIIKATEHPGPKIIEATASKPQPNPSEPKDLLFIEEDLILELPSFAKSSCKVNSYPEGGNNNNMGLVSNRLIACSDSGCWYLQSGAWVNTASMTSGRTYAASSTSDRGWLVTGGREPSVSIANSSEIYNGTNWTAGPSLPLGLYYHCQVQIGSVVIITGGYTGGREDATYSLEGNTWTSISSMNNPRFHHACSEHKGELYVMGGRTSTNRGIDATEKLNLAKGQWRAGPTLPFTVRNNHAVTYNGELYTVGGYGSNGAILRLNTATFTWDTVANTGPTSSQHKFFPAQIIQTDSCLPVFKPKMQ